MSNEKYLNSFTINRKMYKIDVGDKFIDNGKVVQFSPKDETKLPFKNYHRVRICLTQKYIDLFRNNLPSNFEKIEKKGDGSLMNPFDMKYYICTAISEEVDTQDENQNCIVSMCIDNALKFTQCIIDIKEETDKMIYFKESDKITYHSQVRKADLNKITTRSNFDKSVYIMCKFEDYHDVMDKLFKFKEGQLESEKMKVENNFKTFLKLKEENGY